MPEAKREVLNLRAQLRRTEEERDILKKGRAVLRQAVRVKYRLINDHRHEHRIATMCRVLRVTGSGSFRLTISFLWAREPVRARVQKNHSPSSRNAARATLALNSGGCVRLFLLIASLQSTLLMMEESTYLRPLTVQSGGSSSARLGHVIERRAR